jgi:hypothetical protein
VVVRVCARKQRGTSAKVVQRILGDATATMTVGLSGHPVDTNLWDAVDRFADQAARAAGAKNRKPIR